MDYILYGLYVVWTSVSTIYATLHLVFYIVSTVVWSCIDYCMDLYRLLYGFDSSIVWICIDLYLDCNAMHIEIYMNCICHYIFDWGYIYAIY